MSERPPAAGLLLGGGLVLAVGLWIAVIFGAVRQTPGWEGWLTGIFAGGFLALLTYLACAWTAVALLRPRRVRETPGVYSGDGGLEQILAELEATRQDTKARITRAAFWRVPLGVALAVGLWVWSQSTDDPADGSDLIAFVVVGAIAGYLWAAWQLSEAYRRRYKARVLPRIAARFGAPAALVQDNRLLMALASMSGRDLFEPPSYLKPAAARDAVAQLHDDIEAVLRAADAVIDLDQAARLQPRP